jgi:hypothetical protein
VNWDWIDLLPILAFVALAAGLAVVFRRTGSIVAKTREVEGFRSSVRDLAARIDASLAARPAGSTRSPSRLTPDAIAGNCSSPPAVDRYLVRPSVAGALVGGGHPRHLVAQLERAGRALATVEHGATIMSTIRGGARELEAQTSIKRGYLNLLHAREAIAREASRADGMTTRRGDHTM